jgi:hypothetical protein
LTALATTIWAWAVGAELRHGAIIGAGLGLALGIFLDRYMEAMDGRQDLSSLYGAFAAVPVIGVLLALLIIGAIVGFVLRML